MLPQITDLQFSVLGIEDPLPGWYYDSYTGIWYYYDDIGREWYVQQLGIFFPLTIDKLPAPKQVTVGPGDTVRISIAYKYSGPAITGVKERFVIGYEILGILTEKIIKENTRNLSQATTPTLYTAQAELLIPTDVGSNWTVIECKVHNGSPSVPETGIRYTGALIIVGKDPTVTEFSIVDFVKI